MKNLFKSIKKYIIVIMNNIILLLGIGFFISGIMNFSGIPHRGGTFYYYKRAIIEQITIGSILIIIGLLIRVEKK